MNRRAAAIRVLIGALLVLPVIAVAVTWLQRERVTQTAARLPDWGAVSDFSLIEASGRPVRLSDLQGKVWIASFIFTHCAGSCPVMTHHLAQLQKQLPVRDDLRLVSGSVDAER